MEISIIVLEQLAVIGKLAVAMLLGAMIGAERESASKPAGLRTHMLVSGASALIIDLGRINVSQFHAIFGDAVVRTDPIRIVAAVVTGISFLGAGIIIQESRRTDVKYLTTAASLYFVAVVGISIALSQWVTGIGSVLLVLITLRIVPKVENIFKHNRHNNLEKNGAKTKSSGKKKEN